MSVIVAEVDAVMLTASSMVGYELIVEALGFNLIVWWRCRRRSIGFCFLMVTIFPCNILWPWGAECPEVSILHSFKGREYSQHFEAPKVLLPVFFFESLYISPEANGLFHFSGISLLIDGSILRIKHNSITSFKYHDIPTSNTYSNR
jgi:hypothetical protein